MSNGTKQTREIILVKETPLKSWVRDASTFALFVSMIGVGVYLDSTALQWIGAIIAFITIMARATWVKESHTYTISEARKRLDEIERGDVA
jgi:hypothetical protein